MQNVAKDEVHGHYIVLEIVLPVTLPPPPIKTVIDPPPPHFLASEGNLYALPLIPLSISLNKFCNHIFC